MSMKIQEESARCLLCREASLSRNCFTKYRLMAIRAMERSKRNRSDWQFFENEKSVTVGYKNGLVALWNKESSIHQR